MNPLIRNTSGIVAFALAGIAAMGAAPAVAKAQMMDGGAFGAWPFYTWYVPSYESGATAYESFLRGQAEALRADGERALNIARANERQAEADSRMLDNRQKAFEQRLRLRRLGTAEQNAEFETVRNRRNLNMALSDAERILQESNASLGPNETRAAAKLRLAKSMLADGQRPGSAGNKVALGQ